MSQIKVWDPTANSGVGAWVSAVIGATGPTGSTGATGPTGATGATGATGLSGSKLTPYPKLFSGFYETMERTAAVIARPLNSGYAFFVAYVPEQNITISNIHLQSILAPTKNSGIDRCSVGIFYSPTGASAPTSLECLTYSRYERTVASTTNAIFAAANTQYSFALGYTGTDGATPVTNGAPTSYSMTAGTTYWIGIQNYASAGYGTGPQIPGQTVLPAQANQDPYYSVSVSNIGTTNFAVGVSVTSLTPTGAGQTTMPYFKMS